MKRIFVYNLVSLGLIIFYGCQNKEQYAEAVLSALEEKVKTNQDISSDTLVLEVLDYYKRKGNRTKEAEASFYAGGVYLSQKNYNKALELYLVTRALAEQLKDSALIGRSDFFIGTIFYEQLLFAEALEKLKPALEYTRRYSADYQQEIVIFKTMGNCYLIKNEIDTALIYYNKALDLAVLHDDLEQQSILDGNLSVAFRKLGDLNRAKKSLQEAIRLNTEKPAKLYNNLAKLFYEECQYDSAVFYTNTALKLAEKEKNISIQSNLYALLSDIEEKRADYEKALKYNHLYTDLLFRFLEEKQHNHLLAIEKKYNYEQAQNKNNQLLIERQRTYLLLSLLLIIAIIVCFYLYRKITGQKTRILKMENASLESEQQIQALKSMEESFNEKEKSLRNELLSYFEIKKKVGLLKEDKQFTDKTHYRSTPLERINNIVYGDKKGLNWDSFFESINVLHTDIIEKINHAYPSLDPLERKICYLTYMDFNNPEMATLFELALNTIEQKKTNIRKKLNVHDRGNIKMFLIKDLGLLNH